MFNFQSDFLDTYNLLEWTDPDFVKRFWAGAKEGKYEDKLFRWAYAEDLKNLGINLSDLFDEYNMFKEKNSYGIIKKALEEHPNSWPLKALQKVWVLQFKDGLKSESLLSQERYEVARKKKQEEEEQARIKRQAEQHAKAEIEWKQLNEKFNDIKQLIITTIEDCAANTAKELTTKLETSIKQLNEIKALTKGVGSGIYWETNSAPRQLAKLKEVLADKLAEVEIYLTDFEEDTTYAYIRVNIKRFLSLTFDYRDAMFFNIYAHELSNEEEIKAELFNKLKLQLSRIKGPVEYSTLDEQDYKETISLINKAKAAQAAVDSGKEADPSFNTDLIKICTGGLGAANKAYKEWEDVTDGSAGAQYAGYFNGTVSELAQYLIQCNWRALKQDEEVAGWRKTESTDSLIDNVEEALRACGRTGKDFKFEIIK